MQEPFDSSFAIFKNGDKLAPMSSSRNDGLLDNKSDSKGPDLSNLDIFSLEQECNGETKKSASKSKSKTKSLRNTEFYSEEMEKFPSKVIIHYLKKKQFEKKIDPNK